VIIVVMILGEGGKQLLRRTLMGRGVEKECNYVGVLSAATGAMFAKLFGHAKENKI